MNSVSNRSQHSFLVIIRDYPSISSLLPYFEKKKKIMNSACLSVSLTHINLNLLAAMQRLDENATTGTNTHATE
jgi:hypothetical protein